MFFDQTMNVRTMNGTIDINKLASFRCQTNPSRNISQWTIPFQSKKLIRIVYLLAKLFALTIVRAIVLDFCGRTAHNGSSISYSDCVHTKQNNIQQQKKWKKFVCAAFGKYLCVSSSTDVKGVCDQLSIYYIDIELYNFFFTSCGSF